MYDVYNPYNQKIVGLFLFNYGLSGEGEGMVRNLVVQGANINRKPKFRARQNKVIIVGNKRNSNYLPENFVSTF